MDPQPIDRIRPGLLCLIRINQGGLARAIQKICTYE